MDEADKTFINQEVEKNELPEAPMSINIRGYYKGFSIQLTKRMDEKSLELQVPKVMGVVDKMVEYGFEPSWNEATNKASLNPQTTVVAPSSVPQLPCEVCGSPTNFKSGVNKAGKPYKGYFCTVNKDHVKWVK